MTTRDSASDFNFRLGSVFLLGFLLVETGRDVFGQDSRPKPARSIFAPDDPDRMPLPSTTPRASRFFDVLDLVAKRDPMSDDNLTEQIAVSTEALLRKLASGDRSMVADDCVSTILVPHNIPVVFADGNYTVKRFRNANLELHRPHLQTFNDFFFYGGTFDRDRILRGDAFAEPSVLEVEPMGDDSYRTLVSWTLLGFDAVGRLQTNTRWNVIWSQGPNRKIKEIRLASYELIHRLRPNFVDKTGVVLAGTSILRTTIMDGGERTWESTDRLYGTDLLGHTGIAVGDVNGDGRDDVYVCRGGGIPNSLLIHKDDGTVVDTAAAAGVDFLDLTRAALIVDVDGDGDRDLCLSIRNATLVFENDGRGNFGNAPKFSARSSQSSDYYSMAAADFDKNGFVDIYSVRYVQGAYGLTVPIPYFDAKNGPQNSLLSNLGNWTFDDATTRVGLDDGNDRFSLAAAWEDVDDDGDLDLFVANDFGRSNLYIQENGRFRDQAESRGALNIAAGMGVTFADFDRDGNVDLYVSNMYSSSGVRIMSRPEYRSADGSDKKRLMMGHVSGNALFRGLGGGQFENVSERARPEAGGWSWGALFVDINNDGWEDILVPNGNLSGTKAEDVDSLFWRKTASRSPWTATPSDDYANGWAAQSILMQAHYSWAGRQMNATYLNCGDGTFADVSALSGFGRSEDCRAVAVTDWDGDGDLDLWVKSRTAPELLFLENQRTATIDGGTPPRHFVAFELSGKGGNTDAIGSRVFLDCGSTVLRKSVRAGDGYLSQSSRLIHFGLGSIETVEKVRVKWASGRDETFTIPAVDRRYRLLEGTGRAEEDSRIKVPGTENVEDPRPISAAQRIDDRDGYAIELFDRPPLPNTKIDLPGGGAITTEKRLGKPYALLLWSAKSPRSMAALGKIVASRDALKTSGVEILPLSVDPIEDAESTKAMAATVDPTMPILRADPALLDFVDVLQQDVLARTDDLLLPTTIVVDRLGMISALHRGRADAAEIIRSAQRPRQERAPYPGRIVFSGARNYAFFASELRQRKRNDMADFFAAIDRRMRAQAGDKK